jgi:hypothetical protein
MAIEYMLIPLMRMVMNAKLTAERARAPSPYRNFRYPGTEWVFEM